MQCQFYLVGDDIATAKILEIDSRWKFEDLQRAVGGVFNIAQPTGVFLVPGIHIVEDRS